MELRIKIDYDQILRLILQLPKKDIEKLVNILQSDITAKPSSKQIQRLILKAPEWSDADFRDYTEVRSHINKSRIA